MAEGVGEHAQARGEAHRLAAEDRDGQVGPGLEGGVQRVLVVHVETEKRVSHLARGAAVELHLVEAADLLAHEGLEGFPAPEEIRPRAGDADGAAVDVGRAPIPQGVAARGVEFAPADAPGVVFVERGVDVLAQGHAGLDPFIDEPPGRGQAQVGVEVEHGVRLRSERVEDAAHELGLEVREVDGGVQGDEDHARVAGRGCSLGGPGGEGAAMAGEKDAGETGAMERVGQRRHAGMVVAFEEGADGGGHGCGGQVQRMKRGRASALNRPRRARNGRARASMRAALRNRLRTRARRTAAGATCQARCL